jgi:hypothetical protein
LESIPRRVWESRYRAAEHGERSPQESFARVARALARPERVQPALWRGRFLHLTAENRFLPGGRILAGAGRGHNATLANCFAAGTLVDSLEECALTLRTGGGIGIDFSPLRPRGCGCRALRADRLRPGLLHRHLEPDERDPAGHQPPPQRRSRRISGMPPISPPANWRRKRDRFPPVRQKPGWPIPCRRR